MVKKAPYDLSVRSSLVEATAQVEFGEFRFDLRERMLYRDGEEVALPPRALHVLSELLAHPGRVITKEHLFDAVWGGRFVSDGVLKEVVFVLRKALGDRARDPLYIRTVHHRGYKFVGELQRLREDDRDPSPTLKPSWAGHEAVVSLVVALAIVGLLSALITPSPEPPVLPPLHRVFIDLPPEQRVWPVGLALSQDGRQLVYAAKADFRKLYVRRLDESQSQVIAGTAGARRPFLSPSGQWVGFFAGGELRVVPVTGGSPRTLAAATGALGAVWVDDDSIVFARGPGWGLHLVTLSSGNSSAITAPDRAAGESAHCWPTLLHGRKIVYTGWRGHMARSRIAVIDLDSGRTRALIEGGSSARFAPPDHLLYARPGEILAVAVDPEELQLAGAPFPVLRGLDTDPLSGDVQLALSAQGTLAFLPEGVQTGARSLRWLRADGSLQPIAMAPGRYVDAALAPDARHAALTIVHEDGTDLWIADLDTGDTRRLTMDGQSGFALWASAGRHVVYSRVDRGADGLIGTRLFSSPADGSSASVELYAAETLMVPRSISSEDVLLFSRLEPEVGGSSLWQQRLNGQDPPTLLVAADQGAREAVLSPDGDWLAFSSRSGDRSEVFLRSVSGSVHLQVSRSGGRHPLWSADGHRLFFVQDGQLMVVHLTDGKALDPKTPRALLDVGEYVFLRYGPPLSSAAEAGARVDRWLVAVPATDGRNHRIEMISGWRPSSLLTAP